MNCIYAILSLPEKFETLIWEFQAGKFLCNNSQRVCSSHLAIKQFIELAQLKLFASCWQWLGNEFHLDHNVSNSGSHKKCITILLSLKIANSFLPSSTPTIFTITSKTEKFSVCFFSFLDKNHAGTTPGSAARRNGRFLHFIQQITEITLSREAKRLLLSRSSRPAYQSHVIKKRYLMSLTKDTKEFDQDKTLDILPSCRKEYCFIYQTTRGTSSKETK